MARSADQNKSYRRHAPVFAALGDETRLALVSSLCACSPQSISDLCHGQKLTRQAITKHLKVLEGAGLVKNIQQGRLSLFILNPQTIDGLIEYLDRVSAQWDDALSRLKAFVEE